MAHHGLCVPLGRMLRRGPVCGGCSKPLSGRCFKALDKRWHVECFQCGRCAQPLSTSFVEFNERPYCQACYTVEAFVDCTVCRGEVMCLGNVRVCAAAPLTHACLLWVQEMFACKVCSKPIFGTAKIFGDARIHPACYTCRVCTQEIKPGSFRFLILSSSHSLAPPRSGSRAVCPEC